MTSNTEAIQRMQYEAFELIQDGLHESALKIYDEMLSIEPLNQVAVSGKIYSLRSLGRLNDALGFIDTATGAGLDESIILRRKADIPHEMGRYGEAAGHYGTVLEHGLDGLFIRINMADSLHHNDNQEEALECCNKGLEKNPGHGKLLNIKAGVLDKLGRHEEASACRSEAERPN